jgi:gluconate 2-dehydrogenase gamma chain
MVARQPGGAPVSDPKLTRRDFLRDTTIYGGGLWIAFSLPRPGGAAEPSERAVLTEAEWVTVEAITGRVIPTDHEPGAIEAGCANFIDKALAHEDAEARPLYALGIAGAEQVAQRRYGRAFPKLAPAEQDTVLAALEQGGAPGWPEGPVASAAFFATVRAHTLLGFLADPKYGGNRDFAGWKLVGYPAPATISAVHARPDAGPSEDRDRLGTDLWPPPTLVTAPMS